jgi:hypothetical protein
VDSDHRSLSETQNAAPKGGVLAEWRAKRRFSKKHLAHLRLAGLAATYFPKP